MRNLCFLKNSCNDIADSRLKVPEKMLGSAIKHLQDFGLTDEGIIDSIKKPRIIDVITMHPTYVGGFDYTKAMSNVVTKVFEKLTDQSLNFDEIDYDNIIEDRSISKQFKKISYKNQPAVVEENLSVKEEIDISQWAICGNRR